MSEGLDATEREDEAMALRSTQANVSLGWQRDQGWMRDETGEFRLEPPSGYRVVAVDTASCGSVRDLASLRRDLESACFYAESYLDLDEERPPGHRFAGDALWVAALVNYGRAFGGSVRNHEKLDESWLDPSDRARHQFLLSLRDKFVAHSVNDVEHTVVIAFLPDSAFERKRINRTGQVHFEHIPVDADDIRGLVGLTKRWVVHVNRRLKEANSRVQRELMETGVEAAYDLPDLKAPKLDRAKVGKRRPK